MPPLRSLPRPSPQATFYGAGGNGQNGACMLPRGFNGVGVTVAINQAQWEGSGNCGKCIKVRFSSLGVREGGREGEEWVGSELWWCAWPSILCVPPTVPLLILTIPPSLPFPSLP